MLDRAGVSASQLPLKQETVSDSCIQSVRLDQIGFSQLPHRAFNDDNI